MLIVLYFISVCCVLIPPQLDVSTEDMLSLPRAPETHRFLSLALSRNELQFYPLCVLPALNGSGSILMNRSALLWKMLRWWGVSVLTSGMNEVCKGSLGGKVVVGDVIAVIDFLDVKDRSAADTGSLYPLPSALFIPLVSEAEWDDAGLLISLVQRLFVSGLTCWGGVEGATLACAPTVSDSNKRGVGVPYYFRANPATVPPPPPNPYFCRFPQRAPPFPRATVAAMEELLRLGGTPSFPEGPWGALLLDLKTLGGLGEGGEVCIDSEGVKEMLDALAKLACAAESFPFPSSAVASGLAGMCATYNFGRNPTFYHLSHLEHTCNMRIRFIWHSVVSLTSCAVLYGLA